VRAPTQADASSPDLARSAKTEIEKGVRWKAGVDGYAPPESRNEVLRRIAPLVGERQSLSPLFLRFAIEQALAGPAQQSARSTWCCDMSRRCAVARSISVPMTCIVRIISSARRDADVFHRPLSANGRILENVPTSRQELT